MKSNILRPAIFFGLFFGAIMILEFFIFKNFDVNSVKNPALATISILFNYIVFPVAFVILAVFRFKNKHNQGYISFSEVLRIGVTTTAIAALVLGLFSYVYYNYISPEFIDQTIEKMRELSFLQRQEMLQQGATETEIISIEDIEQQLVGARISMQSFFSIAVTIVLYSVIGIVSSIIIATFVKKDNPKSI